MGYDNSAPFEIIAFPYQMWIAPLGTAFPLVDAAPAGTWVKVGTNQDLNYAEDGVKIGHNQDLFRFRALGDAGVRKIFRTSESQLVSLTLVDLTLEQYSLAINSNTVATTAAGGEAGFKVMGLSRGFAVATNALLIRGASPYGDDWTLQYEIPRAAQAGNPEVVFKKDAVAALALAWETLVDPNASTIYERFGRVRAQHATAIS